MSDEEPEGPEGPVHYQVSVTGRQASFFFLTLLASLGLAFFFGMKTGAAARKGREDDAKPVVVAEAPPPAAAEPEPVSILEKERPGARGLAAEKRAEPAPEKRPEKAVERPAEKVAEKPVEVVPEPQPVKPAEKVSEKVAASPEPAPKPVRTAVPAKPPAEKPAPAKPAPTKAAAKEQPASPDAKGKTWVQVTALSAEKADELARKLREAGGFKTDVAPVPDKPGLFRVRVGPYADKAKADAAVRRLIAEKWAKNPYVVKP